MAIPSLGIRPWDVEKLRLYVKIDRSKYTINSEKEEEEQEQTEWKFIRDNLPNVCLKSSTSHREMACWVFDALNSGDLNSYFHVDEVLGKGINANVVRSDKLAIKITDNFAVIHELFVNYHLNLLDLPNFAHWYGYFMCENGLSDDISKHWCQGGNDYMYSVIENVPGITLKKWIKTANPSPEDIYALYLCIFGALAQAHKAFQFTHYDLNAHNVLVTDLGGLKSFSYQINGRPVEIETHYLPVIIDFQTSFIAIDGETFGFYGFENYGIWPKTQFPLEDFVYLINSSLLISEWPIIRRWYSQYCTSPISTLECTLKRYTPAMPQYLEVTYDQIFEYLLKDRHYYLHMCGNC